MEKGGEGSQRGQWMRSGKRSDALYIHFMTVATLTETRSLTRSGHRVERAVSVPLS